MTLDEEEVGELMRRIEVGVSAVERAISPSLFALNGGPLCGEVTLRPDLGYDRQ